MRYVLSLPFVLHGIAAELEDAGDDVSLRRGAVYMVFPYMAHDLAGLLENKKIITLDQSLLKLYARQLLLGTSYLHRVGAGMLHPPVVTI